MNEETQSEGILQTFYRSLEKKIAALPAFSLDRAKGVIVLEQQ